MGKIGNLKEGKTQEAESAMVEIRNVSAGYGKHRVLDGVSLTLQKGQVTTLIGENGSGKSTLLKVLLGFHPLTDGKILIGGILAEKLKRSELAKISLIFRREIMCRTLRRGAWCFPGASHI